MQSNAPWIECRAVEGKVLCSHFGSFRGKKFAMMRKFGGAGPAALTAARGAQGMRCTYSEVVGIAGSARET
jgi:hypothetical protein